MKKEEIVSDFLARGKLLTPSALSFLEPKNNIKELVDQEYTQMILTEKDFQGEKIKIIKNLIEKPEELTPKDFLSFYTSKYEKMKSIIEKRLQKDFISLNKLDSFRNEVYIIGIVKDIEESNGKKKITLEDTTTSLPIIFNQDPGLELDDVVAIKAISAGKVLFGKQVFYPDIPLRAPTKTNGKACFISDLHIDEAPPKDIEQFFRWFENQDIKYLFIAGDTGDKKTLSKLVDNHCIEKKVFIAPGNMDNDEEYPQLAEEYSSKNIISLSNPSMVELNGIKILLIHDMNIDMLKKRYLGISKAMLKEDYLVLEEVPDIVHCGHTHQPHVMNYKSVTIVNSGSPLTDFRPVVIDFSTRDTQQVVVK